MESGRRTDRVAGGSSHSGISSHTSHLRCDSCPTEERGAPPAPCDSHRAAAAAAAAARAHGGSRCCYRWFFRRICTVEYAHTYTAASYACESEVFVALRKNSFSLWLLQREPSRNLTTAAVAPAFCCCFPLRRGSRVALLMACVMPHLEPPKERVRNSSWLEWMAMH